MSTDDNLRTGYVTPATGYADASYLRSAAQGHQQYSQGHHGMAGGGSHMSVAQKPGVGIDRKLSAGKGKGKGTKPAGQPRYWTPEEHRKFMEAAGVYGEKDVKAIAAFVGTRTPTQVRTHAQKYAIRLRREAELREAGIDPKDAKKTGVKQALARAKEIIAKRRTDYGPGAAEDEDEVVEVVDVPGPPSYHDVPSRPGPGSHNYPSTTTSKPIAVPGRRRGGGGGDPGGHIGAGAGGGSGIRGRSHLSPNPNPLTMAVSPPFGSPFASAMKRVRVGSISDPNAHYVQKHYPQAQGQAGHHHIHIHNHQTHSHGPGQMQGHGQGQGVNQTHTHTIAQSHAHGNLTHAHQATHAHDVDPFMISSVLGAASPSLSFLRAHGGLLSPATESMMVRGDGMGMMSMGVTGGIGVGVGGAGGDSVIGGGFAQLSLEDRGDHLDDVHMTGMYGNDSDSRDDSLLASTPQSPMMSALRDRGMGGGLHGSASHMRSGVGLGSSVGGIASSLGLSGLSGSTPTQLPLPPPHPHPHHHAVTGVVSQNQMHVQMQMHGGYTTDIGTGVSSVSGSMLDSRPGSGSGVVSKHGRSAEDFVVTSFNTWVSPDAAQGNTRSVLQEVCPEILSLDLGVGVDDEEEEEDQGAAQAQAQALAQAQAQAHAHAQVHAPAAAQASEAHGGHTHAHVPPTVIPPPPPPLHVHAPSDDRDGDIDIV